MTQTSRPKVESLVADLGPNIIVSARGRSFMVPRHWIALHGLKSVELAGLAQQYGLGGGEGMNLDGPWLIGI